jgi:hypothetical protein
MLSGGWWRGMDWIIKASGIGLECVVERWRLVDGYICTYSRSKDAVEVIDTMLGLSTTAN